MQVRMPHNLVVADVMEDLEGLDSSRLKIHRKSQWAVVAARLDTVQDRLTNATGALADHVSYSRSQARDQGITTLF